MEAQDHADMLNAEYHAIMDEAFRMRADGRYSEAHRLFDTAAHVLNLYIRTIATGQPQGQTGNMDFGQYA